MLATLLLRVCLLSLIQDIHWREGTTLVMLAKLLLRVCLLSLNQDIHWREGTTVVMLAKLLLRVCLLSLKEWKFQLSVLSLRRKKYAYEYAFMFFVLNIMWNFGKSALSIKRIAIFLKMTAPQTKLFLGERMIPSSALYQKSFLLINISSLPYL